MIMCYNPQMSCDAIEKHNYGLKVLKEIKQVGVIEMIDYGRQVGTWKSMCKANTRWPVFF